MKREIHHPTARCLLLLAACTAGVALGRDTGPIEYFCPTTNTAIAGTRSELSGFVYPQYPRTQADANALSTEHQYIRLLITSCTIEQRLCLEIRPVQSSSFTRLVLPRRLEVGREYSFDGVRIVSTYTDLRRRSPAVAQVVLWRDDDPLQKPIKLTVENGRGIIYWEGIDLGLADASPPVCALVSQKGLLAELAVAAPKKSSPQPY